MSEIGICIPATLKREISGTVKVETPFGDESQELSVKEDTGEQLTFDTNLSGVFGTSDLRGPKGSIRVDPLPSDIFATGVISSGRPIFSMIVDGYATAIIQIGGTWTGTCSFEAWPGGAGDVVPIAGMSTAILSQAVITATANGAWRFNIAGMKQIRVRFSTATTGNPTVTIGASVQPSVVSLGHAITGSQSQALTQRATTFELNTYDTNIATVLGIVSLLSPGTWALAPTRLKVEGTGRDIGDPGLRNLDGTFQVVTQDRQALKMLERINTQLSVTNRLLLSLVGSAGGSLEGFSLLEEAI
jgi:hypothetical protein